MKNGILFVMILFLSLSSTLSGQALSEYEPKELETRTIEIIDSLFLFYGTPVDTSLNINGVFYDSTIHLYDNSKKILDVVNRRRNRSEQFRYWQSTRKAIPKKDFFILKNHPSPFIRWYIYSHIVEKKLVPANLEFLLAHLTDIESVNYFYRNRDIYSIPLILHLLREPKISKKEKKIFRAQRDSIGRMIFSLDLGSEQMNDYAVKRLTFSESNYEIFQLYVKQNNMHAIQQLLRYRNEEDQELLEEKLSNLLLADTMNLSYAFLLSLTVRHDFPKISLDKYLEFHEKAKRDGQLEKAITYYSFIYSQIVRKKYPQRVLILKELLEEAYSEKHPKSKVAKQIENIISHDHGADLLDLRLHLWEEYGLLGNQILKDILQKYPKRGLQIVLQELDHLETDEFNPNTNCRFSLHYFLAVLDKNNLSTEKYINWALQSQNAKLNGQAVSALGKKPFLSAKSHLFTLLESTEVIHLDDKILVLLNTYSLNDQEKNRIKSWFKKTEPTLGMGLQRHFKKLLGDMGITNL